MMLKCRQCHATFWINTKILLVDGLCIKCWKDRALKAERNYPPEMKPAYKDTLLKKLVRGVLKLIFSWPYTPPPEYKPKPFKNPKEQQH